MDLKWRLQAEALRVIYFMLSIILYNLWILTRIEVQGTAITVYFFKHIVKTEITLSRLEPLKWLFEQADIEILVWTSNMWAGLRILGNQLT